MCGWETLLIGALTASSALMSQTDYPDPPAAQNPATPAPTAREPGAIVRVGGDAATEQMDTTPEYTPFTERRAAGKALGGLGRSGIGL